MTGTAACRFARLAVLSAMLAAWSSGAVAQSEPDPRCHRIDSRVGFGPFDYRNAEPGIISKVENAHFTSEIQRNAMRGEWKASNGSTWFNIDYTLRALPNHPRALYMLGTFELQLGKFNEEAWRELTRRSEYAPSICYFQRAARLAPDDAGVPNSLGILLHRAGKQEEALNAFERAVKLAPNAPEAHYNLGLSQFALGQYEQAAASARRAYELGYRKQDLKVKLQRKGHWR